jgi:hypothetical protein
MVWRMKRSFYVMPIPDHVANGSIGDILGVRQSASALPPISDVDLLRNREGIVHFNAQIPNGAFDLFVTEKQLYGS